MSTYCVPALGYLCSDQRSNGVFPASSHFILPTTLG